MDEATSSIDLETDQKITRVIRESFSGTDTTLLIIAHRLATVMNLYARAWGRSGLTRRDRILVMENGQIVEDGR